MALKHKKLRNTGLLYELLVRQVVSDLLVSKNSAAEQLLETYFSKDSLLRREYELYEILNEVSYTDTQINGVISSVLSRIDTLNIPAIEKLKYNLIFEIKKNYDLKEFVSFDIPNYKYLASIYLLLEAHKNNKIPLKELSKYRNYILENRKLLKKEKDSDLKDFCKEDAAIRALSIKLMTDTFNKKYSNLNEWQTAILNDYTTLNPAAFKTKLNENIKKIASLITNLSNKVDDKILSIKLTEIKNNLRLIPITNKVADSHIYSVLSHVGLVNELQKL